MSSQGNYLNQEQHFKEWLESKGLKAETVKDYLFYYDKLSFDQLQDRDYISAFLNDYNNNSVARAFLKNLLYYHGIKNIELPKMTGRRKKRIPEVITEATLLKIVEAMTTERNKIMALITFYCGLRKGELLKIKPGDFNWDDCKSFPSLSNEELKDKFGRVRVLGKGDKQRLALVPGALMVRIGKFIKHKLKINYNPELMKERMFKIGARRWATILSEASIKSIGKHLNPHALRHSYGTFLLRKGMDLRYIKEAMGHSSISSTQIYTHVQIDDLEEQFSKKLSGKN